MATLSRLNRAASKLRLKPPPMTSSVKLVPATATVKLLPCCTELALGVMTRRPLAWAEQARPARARAAKSF